MIITKLTDSTDNLNRTEQGIKDIPLYASGVSAGFPSPADDYIEANIDLHTHLIKHPSATFFARANGNSMIDRGIFDGDLLIIDRSIKAVSDAIVIAAINGEMVCKILNQEKQQLLAANPYYPPIQLSDEMDCLIEGVVIHSIRHQFVKAT